VTRLPTSDSSLVDVDASVVFRRPLFVVLVITFVIGALDGVGYRHLGVFTANQAGNLVIGTTLIAQDPAVAVLAIVSVLGCGLGVASIVLVRFLRPWLAGPSGSRALMIAAAVLVVAASIVGEWIAPNPSAGGAATGALWTASWWATALAVAMAAFSVAMLGMVFISGGGVRAPVLASTNAYVDGVRYGVAGALDRTHSSWPAQARRAAAFPLAWTLGAATAVAGVNPLSRAGVTGAAGIIVVLVALLARRVTVADPARRPTV
jgi:hypothetical protein